MGRRRRLIAVGWIAIGVLWVLVAILRVFEQRNPIFQLVLAGGFLVLGVFALRDARRQPPQS